MSNGENGLEPRIVRCSGCGRFLVYVILTDGVVLIKCKNCKQFTIIAEGSTGENLTTKDLYTIISPKQ